MVDKSINKSHLDSYIDNNKGERECECERESSPFGLGPPLRKTSQSPSPVGLSTSQTGVEVSRWRTLLKPRVETGRSSSKYF